MRRAVIGLACLLAVATAASAASVRRKAPKRLTISALKRLAPSSGTFRVSGFIAKVYACPPCPKGALCKPCMRDNVVVSEEDKRLELYSLTEKELILFVKDATAFRTGLRCEFTVKVLDRRSTSEPLNDLEAVDFRRF